jgi:hypothetical protein
VGLVLAGLVGLFSMLKIVISHIKPGSADCETFNHPRPLAARVFLFSWLMPQFIGKTERLHSIALLNIILQAGGRKRVKLGENVCLKM